MRSRSLSSSGTTSTVGRPHLRLELRRRPFGDEAAAVDDRDAIGEGVGFLEVLRGQEDGHALLLRQPPHLLPQRGPALGVETGRGLVQEDDPRRVHERERKVEPPLHSARVRAHAAALRPPTDRRVRGAPLRVSALRRTCSRASLPGAGRAPWRSAGGSSAASCSATPISGVPRPLSRDVVPADEGLPAARRRQQRDEHLDRRALPCAVRAEASVDLAFVHVQIDPVDRAWASLELPDELVNLDRVLGNLWRSLGCLQWLLALRASRLESIIFRPTLSFVARVLRSPRW